MATLAALMGACDMRLAGLPRGRTLGQRLAVARERRSWSVTQAADRAGVSPNAVRRAEADQARVATVEGLLNILAPDARARKPERARWESGRRDCRWTPPEVFDSIERAVGPFDLDPCGEAGSPVRAATIYTEADDGLSLPWMGKVYCNPPYSGAAAFLQRAYTMWSAGACAAVVLLLPVQTHLAIFHDLVVGHADVLFLRDRVRFIGPEGRRDRAPFPSMIVIYGGSASVVGVLLDEFACVHLPRDAARSTAKRSRGIKRNGAAPREGDAEKPCGAT